MNNKAWRRRALAWLFTLLTLASLACGLSMVGLIWASPGETGPWGMWHTGGEGGYEGPFRTVSTILVGFPTMLAVLGFGAAARCFWRDIDRRAGTGAEGK
jgi:hypothetical protein